MEHDPERDELSLLAAARPDPTPSPGTVDAHRKALTAAMGRQRPAANWRRIAVAAAVLPLAAAAAVLFTDAPDESTGPDESPESTETEAPELQLASSHAFYGAPRCGTEPPPDLTIPEGFTGPVDGPSPDAVRPPEADQLVRHWTKGTATIELRWYADPEAVPPILPGGESDIYQQVEHLGDGETLSSGRHYLENTWTSDPSNLDDPCTWVQLWVFDDDRPRAVETFNRLGRGCFSDELPPEVSEDLNLPEPPVSDLPPC